MPSGTAFSQPQERTQGTGNVAGVRHATVWLWAIVALGAGFRLFHLGAQSLWQDEPATVALARMSWPDFVRLWWYGEASFQSLYFLLMRGWLHLGNSEFWIRLPAAIFGIAAIPVIYFVARELVGNGAALASAALLAFSPTHVYYSQEARTYTMTIVLVLLSSWFFVQAVEQNRERDWILWTIFSVLAVYGHYFASLVLVSQAISLFLCKKPAPWKKMILHAFIILAMTLPGVTYMFRGSPGLLAANLNAKATPKQLLHIALFLGGSGEKLVPSAILWFAGVAAIRRERLCRSETEIFWRGVLVILWATIPIFLIALVSLRYPVFVQRYMIFSLPAAIMLAGRGMSALPKRNLGLWLVVVLCAASIVNIVIGYRKPREDWRGATNAIIRSAAPGDALLIYPLYARPGFDYYYDLQRENAPALRVFTAPFYGFGEDDQGLLRALNSNPLEFRHVWVMVRKVDPGLNNLGEDPRAVVAQLQSIFGVPVTRQFQNITLLEFSH